MNEPIRIDCASVSEVDAPSKLAALTASGRHVVLQFRSLSEEEKSALIDRLSSALPDHSVFFSGGGTGYRSITVMPVVARSRVLERRAQIVRAVEEYRHACLALMLRYRSRTLEGDWRTDEHGGHCLFVNHWTGQVVEAPLEMSDDWLDPYFFAEFVRSTPGLEPVAELLTNDFHDAARMLDVVFGATQT